MKRVKLANLPKSELRVIMVHILVLSVAPMEFRLTMCSPARDRSSEESQREPLSTISLQKGC